MKLSYNLQKQKSLSDTNPFVYSVLNFLTITETQVVNYHDFAQTLLEATKEKTAEQTRAIVDISNAIESIGRLIQDSNANSSSKTSQNQAQVIGQLTSTSQILDKLQEQPDENTIKTKTMQIVACLNDKKAITGFRVILNMINLSCPNISQSELNQVISNLMDAAQRFQSSPSASAKEGWVSVSEKNSSIRAGKTYASTLKSTRATEPEVNATIAPGSCTIS